jgi:hypothetical protein
MIDRTENKEKRWKYGAVVDAAAPLVLGFVAYSVAAVSTFSIPQLTHVGLDQVAIASLTFIAGLFTIGLGYESIVLFGGVCSLSFAGFVARVTKSRQLIEIREKKSPKLLKTLIEKSHLVYLPALLFFTSVSLGWDIFTALPARTARSAATPGNPARITAPLADQILHSLNFFATPQRANAVMFSLRLTPALILMTMISGLVPSIALPYFRRFRITGINAGPFHSSLLTAVIGSVVGLSILLSLLGIFYSLWAGGAPTSYHYALIVLAGLSLHYAAGTYIGRDRSESIILRKLAEGKYDRNRIVVLHETLNQNVKIMQLQSLFQDRWD